MGGVLSSLKGGVQSVLSDSGGLETLSASRRDPNVSDVRHQDPSRDRSVSSPRACTTSAIYNPISSREGEIRLLKIEQGTFDDPIRCSLTHAFLSRKQGYHDGLIGRTLAWIFPARGPEYEALSYVWGSVENRVPILLNETPFHVTQNLESAIRYLRLEDKDRVMWIDAICINQEDTKERGEQVEQMKHIYSSAAQVVCWLVTDGAEVANAYNLALDLQHVPGISYTTPSTISRIFSWIVGIFHSPGVDSDVLERIFKSLDPLLGSGITPAGYWKRAWITQEVSLAPRAVIQVGGICFPETLLRKLLDRINSMGREPFRIRRDAESMRRDAQAMVMRQWLRMESTKTFAFLSRLKEKEPLLGILRENRAKLASDPRDKVYAFVGLSDMSEGPNSIAMDYGKSTTQVFVDAAVSIVQATGYLDVVGDSSPWRSNIPDLPTWAPDWTSEPNIPGAPRRQRYGRVSSTSRLLRIDGASGESHADAHFTNARGKLALCALGYRVGVVSHLTQVLTLPPTEPTMQVSANDLHNIWAMWDVPGEMDFLRTSNCFCQYSLCRCSASDRSTSTNGPGETLVENVFVQHLTHHRYFILARVPPGAALLVPETDTGVIIGAGPRSLEEDDIICILLGCDLPLALRPAADGTFELVGAVFVPCLVNGIAMEYLDKGVFRLERFTVV